MLVAARVVAISSTALITSSLLAFAIFDYFPTEE